jgi:hypothetical protein
MNEPLVIECPPVQPGDLLWLQPFGTDQELSGIVLSHFEKYQGRRPSSVRGPGVLIYWITSNTMAHWDYESIHSEISDKKMGIICRPTEK